MKLSAVLLAISIAATVQTGEPTPSQNPEPDPRGQVISPRAPEPPTSPVLVGDPAPGFSWTDPDRRNVNLRDALAQGPVLLVFGPSDDHLRALEHARDSLLDLGVVPVAVMNLGNRAAASRARKLGLHFTVVGDSRRVIANQYDVVDDVRQSIVPAWFIVDGAGRVRALGRTNLPMSGYPRLVATVLAIPQDGATVPTRAR